MCDFPSLYFHFVLTTLSDWSFHRYWSHRYCCFFYWITEQFSEKKNKWNETCSRNTGTWKKCSQHSKRCFSINPSRQILISEVGKAGHELKILTEFTINCFFFSLNLFFRGLFPIIADSSLCSSQILRAILHPNLPFHNTQAFQSEKDYNSYLKHFNATNVWSWRQVLFPFTISFTCIRKL